MHESTISRVTTNKYMLTPRGIFEFKYFFLGSRGHRRRRLPATAIRPMLKNGRGRIAIQTHQRQQDCRNPVAAGHPRGAAHDRQVPRAHAHSAFQPAKVTRLSQPENPPCTSLLRRPPSRSSPSRCGQHASEKVGSASKALRSHDHHQRRVARAEDPAHRRGHDPRQGRVAARRRRGRGHVRRDRRARRQARPPGVGNTRKSSAATTAPRARSATKHALIAGHRRDRRCRPLHEHTSDITMTPPPMLQRQTTPPAVGGRRHSPRCSRSSAAPRAGLLAMHRDVASGREKPGCCKRPPCLGS